MSGGRDKLIDLKLLGETKAMVALITRSGFQQFRREHSSRSAP